jgi:hypothetical protein
MSWFAFGLLDLYIPCHQVVEELVWCKHVLLSFHDVSHVDFVSCDLFAPIILSAWIVLRQPICISNVHDHICQALAGGLASTSVASSCSRPPGFMTISISLDIFFIISATKCSNYR